MENNIVYDLILLEADRIISRKLKSPKLYYENSYGEIVPLAEPWSAEVDMMVNNIFKKKKMRYLITFVDALKIQDELNPSAVKMLRFMAGDMNYGNYLKGYGLRDIRNATGMNMRYVLKAIGQLCEHDIIRFYTEKGRRTYMVNPIYFYKGSMKSIFSSVKNYNSIPKNTEDGDEEYEFNED